MLTLQKMFRNDLIHQTMLSRNFSKKVIPLIKDELVVRIMKEFVALRPKIYSYQTNEDYVEKKAKCKKK